MNKEKQEKRVLVTAIGVPGGFALLSWLRNNGERKIRIFGTEVKPNVPAASLTEKSFQVPKATSKKYLDSLCSVIEKTRPDVIFPLSDEEILVISKNANRIQKQYETKCLVSSPHSIEMALDKFRSANFMRRHGIPCPEYYRIRSVDEFLDAHESLQSKGRITCVKPRYGRGSRGFWIISDKRDVARSAVFNRCNQKITKSAFCEVLENMSKQNEFLAMEYLPGDEYSIDILGRHGWPIQLVQRMREETQNGISWVGRITDNSKVNSIARRISILSKIDGPFGIQLRCNSRNDPNLIEVNPRIHGTVTLSAAAGVNIPYMSIKYALGEKIQRVKARPGTMIRRYMAEIYYG